MMPRSFALSESLLRLLVSSAILLVVVVVLRALVAGYIRRNVEAPDLRRRWLVQSRNGLILLLSFGLLVIWGEELRTLALSVVAVAIAFVVATKELILCISGSVLKAGSRSFSIGDRIQVKDFRGDVIDQTLLATTLLEIGPGKSTHQRTGRTTVIPNSIFLSEPVINESYTDDYVIHVFVVPFKRADDWPAAKDAFLASANRHCEPYLQDVRGHMSRLARQRGLELPSAEPRVTLEVPTAGEVHLVVRIPVKSRERGYVEQSILSEVLGQHDFSARREGALEERGGR